MSKQKYIFLCYSILLKKKKKKKNSLLQIIALSTIIKGTIFQIGLFFLPFRLNGEMHL